MSWSGTWSHDVLIGLDCFGAAVFFGRSDTTISGLCYVVRQADAGAPGWQQKLDSLKLRPWQISALRHIGDSLEYFWPGHCAEAATADMQRGKSAVDLYTA